MEVHDCARLSRAVSALLDENDPIQGEYDLEVSSPGIDRPLMRIEDFERFVGHTAKLETLAMVEGRKRFKGDIVGVDGANIRVRTPEGEEVSLPFAGLCEARLVLTDKLIEQDLKRAKAAEQADASEEEDLEPEGEAIEEIGREAAPDKTRNDKTRNDKTRTARTKQ
jgi:ribosome maturation factor RimP